MHVRLRVACAAAAVQMAAAWAQAPAPPQHPGPHSGQSEAKLAKPAAPSPPSAAYKSPFAGYRPFTLEEPMKDWRVANEEVRAAGGHIGLMKGAHGAHGAKEPAKGAKP